MKDLRQRFSPAIKKIESYGAVVEQIVLSEGKKNYRMSVTVQKKGTVRITAKRVSDEKILSFLISHARWIAKRLNDLEKRVYRPLYGDNIVLFGKTYTVMHGDDFADDKNIYASSEENIVKLTYGLMEKLTLIYMTEITQETAARYGFLYDKIGITKDKSKWGYCKIKQKEIKYNPLIALTDKSCADYLAAHELAHLKVTAHNEQFWKTVKEMAPDYKACVKRLKEYSYLAECFY